MVDQVVVLNSDGRIDTLNENSISNYQHVDGDTDPTTLPMFDDRTIVINFNSSADGRGFSLVKAIRQDRDYQGKIMAAGDINPDQLSLAFQVGFDAVIVPAENLHNYGEDSWRAALNPSVQLSYSKTQSDAINSIWQQRHSTWLLM